MRSIPLVAIMSVLASPAFASPVHKQQCIPLEKLKKEAGDGMKTTPLTAEQFAFVQGFWAGLPNTPPGLPPADSAIMALQGGASVVFWMKGKLTCGMMQAPPGLIKMLSEISPDKTDEQSDDKSGDKSDDGDQQ